MNAISLHARIFAQLLADFGALEHHSAPEHKAELLAGGLQAGWRPQLGLNKGSPAGKTELELARALRAGDGDAFDRLFERYHGRLAASARASGCADEAEDFAQDAFVSLMTTAPVERPEFDVARYLFKVVRNRVIKRQLHLVRQRSSDDADRLPDAAARDALVALSARLGLKAVAEIIVRRCRPLEQNVLALSFEGKTAAEIGAELEITAGNARVLRHRALARIRTELAGGDCA